MGVPSVTGSDITIAFFCSIIYECFYFFSCIVDFMVLTSCNDVTDFFSFEAKQQIFIVALYNSANDDVTF